MAFEVFISYSHPDQKLRRELDKHLSNLKQQNIITSWYDGNISPGAEWESEIMKRLKRAQIILLLVSADFMASDFCYSIEMKEAIARHDADQARVIPILLRPTDWQGAPFAKLKMLPTDAKAVSRWPTLDDAFEDVVQGIRTAIDDLNTTWKTPKWSIVSGLKPLRWTLRGHKWPIKSVAISSSGQTLASGSSDSTINVWDPQAKQLLHTLTGHVGPVESVAISSDGQILASGSNDKTIKVWNLHTGQLLRSLSGHIGPVGSVAISSDGQVLASGSDDMTIKVWDLHTGQELRTLPGRLPHSQANGRADKYLRFATWLNNETQKTQNKLTRHVGPVNSVAISSDGRILTSGSDDMTIKVWDLHTGRWLHTLTGHIGAVSSVAISSDEQILASGSNDMTIKVWDLHTWQELRTLPGHIGAVQCVAISPDGQTLASGSNDKTIRVWNIHTGEELLCIRTEQGSVQCVAISPDGQFFASGGADMTIKVWEK